MTVIFHLKLENLNRKKSEHNTETITNFKEKRLIGENVGYICQLIRNDSIEEFAYVNKTNLSLSKTTIKPSFFETNSIIIKNKEITLIEYTAFFGSIQVFQYLSLNNVDLKPSLWLYSIYSKNADLIHLIEESDINPPNNTYKKCLEESNAIIMISLNTFKICIY